MTPSKRSLRVIAPVLLASGVALAFAMYSPISSATPSIAWQPKAISQTVPPGQSRDIPVSFTASANIPNSVVTIVPELQPYVQVTPSILPSVKKGDVIVLTVALSVPATTPPITVDGAVRLSVGSSTIARPLPVTLHVGSEYSDDEYGFALYYPSDFDSSRSAVEQPAVLDNRILRSPDGAPSISVTVYDNASLSPVNAWYEETLADKEFSIPDAAVRSVRSVTVAGVSSLQVHSDINGVTAVRTYVPHNDVVIGITTSVPDNVPIPGLYFEIIESVELF